MAEATLHRPVATAVLAAALALGSFSAGYAVRDVINQWEHERALQACEKAKKTSYVVKQRDAWHCFNEHPDYPYRISRVVLILPKE